MANATPAPNIGASGLNWAPKTVNPFAAPSPSASPCSTLYGPAGHTSRHPRGDIAVAREVAREKRQHWAALHLRQDWADADFMRGHLRLAGVQVKFSAEPATVARLKSKLRAVGIQSPEIQDAIGMPLGRFLQVNPRLPLWAALALVLESTGRYAVAGGTL